jgi:hypothetical protein
LSPHHVSASFLIGIPFSSISTDGFIFGRNPPYSIRKLLPCSTLRLNFIVPSLVETALFAQ